MQLWGMKPRTHTCLAQASSAELHPQTQRMDLVKANSQNLCLGHLVMFLFSWGIPFVSKEEGEYHKNSWSGCLLQTGKQS